MPENPADDPSSDAGPGMLTRLWQQRLVVASSFGTVLFLLVGLLLLLPVSYVATGSVIVADREAVGGSTPPSPGHRTSDPVDVETVVLLIRSPRLLRAVLDAPGAMTAMEAGCAAGARQWLGRLYANDCAMLADTPEARLHWAQERLGVGVVGQSRVVAVSFRSSSPIVAQAMVNSVMQEFLADERGKLRHSHDEAMDRVRQRLAQLDQGIQADAAAAKAFRDQHGLVRGVDGTLASEQLAQAVQSLGEARTAEAEAETRLQETRGGVVARQASDSRAVADLKQQLAQASALSASAAQRYGTQNPALLAYRRQEADLASRLTAEMARAGEAARRGLEAARQRVTQAQAELAARTSASSETADAEARLAGMTRDLDVKRGSRAGLLQRLGQLETEQMLLEPSVRLVNLAERPTRPAFPQRPPFLIGGLALATLTATAAGLLSFKPVQSGPIALGRTYTRVPILAQVPELRLRQSGKEQVGRSGGFPFAAAVSLLDTHPPLLEALRILHARLVLAGFGTERRTLLVTSEVVGEGKSFVTLALARMAHASGRRVLVIEACLRAPFLENALHCSAGSGLAGYLRGGAATVTQLGAVPGVDFLLAGGSLGDSTELLAGNRFRELLARLEDYDLVLIDSAPVAELMDAALIAPQVDGVLFCLRAGRPPAVDALNSLPEMQRTNGNVVGLTLTFVPDDKLAAPGLGQTRTAGGQRQLAAEAV